MIIRGEIIKTTIAPAMPPNRIRVEMIIAMCIDDYFFIGTFVLAMLGSLASKKN